MIQQAKEDLDLLIAWATLTHRELLVLREAIYHFMRNEMEQWSNE